MLLDNELEEKIFSFSGLFDENLGVFCVIYSSTSWLEAKRLLISFSKFEFFCVEAALFNIEDVVEENIPELAVSSWRGIFFSCYSKKLLLLDNWLWFDFNTPPVFADSLFAINLSYFFDKSSNCEKSYRLLLK